MTRKRKTHRPQRQRKLSEREKQIRNQVAKAVHAIRQGIPAYRAARENGVSVRTIKKRAGKDLVQERRGARIRAKSNDRLLRYLEIPGPDGPIEIAVRGLKAAREVAKYKAAVNRFLRGDRNALLDWKGKRIASVKVITDASTLVDQADKGLLHALYRSFAGGAV